MLLRKMVNWYFYLSQTLLAMNFVRLQSIDDFTEWIQYGGFIVAHDFFRHDFFPFITKVLLHCRLQFWKEDEAQSTEQYFYLHDAVSAH